MLRKLDTKFPFSLQDQPEVEAVRHGLKRELTGFSKNVSVLCCFMYDDIHLCAVSRGILCGIYGFMWYLGVFCAVSMGMFGM